ncbi:MAG: peptidase S8 [Lacrimispora celerecrescens]|nr:peptidase S8 [Lacrimispora celerecrescens]
MQRVLDENYYDLIAENSIDPIRNEDVNMTLLNEAHHILHVSTHEINICDQRQVPYYSLPELFTPISIIDRGNADIESFRYHSEPAFYGKDIIIGILSTGIDYQHPVFLNADKTTCIISMWDQSEQSGVIPEGFTFGSEYTRDMINQALISEDPLSVVPSRDTNGHGTAIASIIAGRPESNQSFSGIVPESELVIVKLKEAKQNLKQLFFVPDDLLCFQETDLMLGIRYLVTVSENLKRPLVICIALESNQGGHDGISPISTYLNIIAGLPNIGVCIAAGDGGNKERHYFNSTFSQPYYNDFQLNVGSSDKLFFMEIWPYAPSTLSIEVISPLGESTESVDPSLVCKEFTFEQSQSILLINNFVFESGGRNPLILIRFRNPYPGVWHFRALSIENTPFSFHTWLPAGNLISNETFFFESDPDTTVSSPGTTTSPITVTAYNQVNRSILIESSRGYTRIGEVKPDIAAPGYQIPCAVPESQYGVISGTGAAVGYAAGAIAIALEWAGIKRNFVNINGNQIRGLLTFNALRDSDVIYPNKIWGYGILDIENLLNMLLST